jgi:hypothetical protein
VVTHTFHTGGSVYDIDGGTFCDGIGWAFRQTCAAGNAFFGDFHCHGSITPINNFLQTSWLSLPGL